jgi:hypothetical protein
MTVAGMCGANDVTLRYKNKQKNKKKIHDRRSTIGERKSYGHKARPKSGHGHSKRPPIIDHLCDLDTDLFLMLHRVDILQTASTLTQGPPIDFPR